MKESKKYDITVAGHICLDIIPDIPDTGIKNVAQLFAPGKLIRVNAAKLSTGGPVSNTGLALARLGFDVAFMARLGDDVFGSLILDLLQDQGGVKGLSVSADDRTSYTVAIAPPGIDRIFFHDPGANDNFSLENVNIEVVEQSKLFHFGYPPLMASCYRDEGAELERIFRAVKSAGATTSLDMALPDPNSESGRAPWTKILQRVLPHVDIFLPSIEELFYMLDREQYGRIKSSAGTGEMLDFIDPALYPQLAESCLDLGCDLVALKTAHRGYYVRVNELHSLGGVRTANPSNWAQRELWCPAFAVKNIASATGSGDSSIAGFLAALLKGTTIEQALKYANIAGYLNLHELDALSGLKSWRETTSLLERTTPGTIPLQLDESYWRWRPDLLLWLGRNDRYYEG